MTKPLIVTARKIVQGDTVFYETAMNAYDLVNPNYISVDRWNTASQEGYQREINENHVRRIANYIKGKVASTNIMPSNIIINWREPLRVTELKEVDGFVQIELKDFPGYVVDGQHRVAALSEVLSDIGDKGEELDNYEFGVTITNFSIEEEMIHFKNLNLTANRPSKGLSQIIGHQLNVVSGVAPMTWTEQATNRAVALTVRLATDPESPWNGKIAIGGTRKRSFHTTVQSAMVDSLLPLFTNGRFSDPELKIEFAYEAVLNFWNAVEITWPESMGNPDASLIQHTLGMYPLNKLLIKIFNNLLLNPTQADFDNILANIKDNLPLGESGWEDSFRGQMRTLIGGYSVGKSRTIIADYLWSGIDEKTKVSLKTA